eukprot:3386267-Prymnesium_polylepis.1
MDTTVSFHQRMCAQPLHHMEMPRLCGQPHKLRRTRPCVSVARIISPSVASRISGQVDLWRGNRPLEEPHIAAFHRAANHPACVTHDEHSFHERREGDRGGPARENERQECFDGETAVHHGADVRGEEHQVRQRGGRRGPLVNRETI